MVFSGWKGIATVRQYVVPANPKTTAQTTQRNVMKAIVALWKPVAAVAVLKAGWNLFAQLSGSAMSGFNMFTRYVGISEVQTAAAPYVSAVTVTPNTSAACTLKKVTDGTSWTATTQMSCKIGTNKAKLDTTVTATPGSGTVTFSSASFASKSYYQVWGPNVTIDGVATPIPASGICQVP